jgi:hypothetical protein
MRAKIGKYPHWFTTQRAEHTYLEWRHKKPAWDVDERDYNWLDKTVVKILDGWQTVLYYTVNKIQSRKQQKVRVHVDDWDVWEAKTTFAHIILPVLERLRDEKQGAPFVDDNDVPAALRSTAKQQKKLEETGEIDNKHFDRWDYILDSMIWSFREIAEGKPGEEQFFTGKMDIVWTPVDVHGNKVSEEDRKYYRMDRGENDTHEVDWEGLQAYEDRIDYGLRMFGKYFRGLWN